MQVEPRPGGALARVSCGCSGAGLGAVGGKGSERDGRNGDGVEREGGTRLFTLGKRGIMNPERLRDPRCTQSIDSDVGGSLATSIDRHYIGKGQANQFVAALSLLSSPLPSSHPYSSLAFLFRVLFNFPLFIFSHHVCAFDLCPDPIVQL